MTAAVTALAAALLTLWVAAPLFRRAAEVTAQKGLEPSSERECPRCGPRPESDARYCSNCGAATGGAGATPASS